MDGFRPSPSLASERVFPRITQRLSRPLLGPLDLLVEFATLGEYGLDEGGRPLALAVVTQPRSTGATDRPAGSALEPPPAGPTEQPPGRSPEPPGERLTAGLERARGGCTTPPPAIRCRRGAPALP
jgi:hypothetical protein